MTPQRTAIMLQRLPKILAVTAASYGLSLDEPRPQLRNPQRGGARAVHAQRAHRASALAS